MSDTKGVPRSFFDTAYAGSPPWEIGRPQGDIVRLYERGGLKGRVLDLGCGTGENALYLASVGMAVHGIDAVPAAVERATAKAAERNLKATFAVADALKYAPAELFDTVIDSGVFHVFDDADRQTYARQLQKMVKLNGLLHILCFSDMEPPGDGPRRVTERELIDLLNMRGWLVEEIAEARYETTTHPDGARAWLATFMRYGS